MKNKKGILRNALVFLFSVMFTMSAYAADVYAAEYYTAAQAIEQNTIAPTTEMLGGNIWYMVAPEEITTLIFGEKAPIMSINKTDKYGNNSSLIGEYQLNGNEINIAYIAFAKNGNVKDGFTPICKTHYIGLTDDGSCIFSIDGIDYISLERMSNE